MTDIIKLNLDIVSFFNNDSKSTLNNSIKRMKSSFDGCYFNQCYNPYVLRMSAK